MELKPLKMNKKGVLGLDTAKTVFIAFLVLSVLAIAVFLALTNVRDVAETIDTTSLSVYNETLSDIGGTGGDDLTYAKGDTYRNSVCTITYVQNQSSGLTIVAANYTTSNGGCTITSTTAAEYNGSSDGVNVTYTVIYGNPESNLITMNITSALSNDFFDQTGTIFAILIVVVIILAIGIIIAVVSRFGAGGGVGIGRGSSPGSDTVMGV